MRTIAIAGVGLIGGSFALAMRRAGFSGCILGVSSPRTIAKALEAGVIDSGASLEEAAAQADLIYLAQPVSGIMETMSLLAPLLRPGMLVTDAASTKQRIVTHAGKVFRPGQFLGGHPMAGKELRGVEAAEAALFSSRTYVLTPQLESDLESEAAQEFLRWLREFGARIVTMTAAAHDRTVAFTSHLPQLLSTALACTLEDELPAGTTPVISGSGLQDNLRLALSPWDVWGDIIETNQESISHALKVYIDKLTKFRQNLQTRRLREDFATANRAAVRFRR